MECLGISNYLSVAYVVRRGLSSSSKKKILGPVSANLKGVDDPYFRDAFDAAALRCQETFHPEPLFTDPYVACLVPHRGKMGTISNHTDHHCITTKFIDDKLINTMGQKDGLRQVVLLTDGMDTRPYRIAWPKSTLIFEVSPERVYREAAQKLKDIGAKIPRSCILIHIPLESPDIKEYLCRRGFSGNRPSIWVVQGLPIATLASFEDVLFNVSSLAMKGCTFIGELPGWLAETEIRKTSKQKCLENLFMTHGFLVDTVDHQDVAKSLGRELAAGDHYGLLFTSEQLRFSDNQMEIWRREFQRIEEEGEEEGFEEL